ncbi:Ankyrin repeat, partial [Globisporangium splendens]
MRAKIHAAIEIQRHFRAKRAHRLVKTLLHENRCALRLQRAFRDRKARRLAAFKRKEHGDATTIQSLWRGYWTRKQEQQLGLNVQRKIHLRRRLAALQIQRVFRGWCGRKAVYREKVVRTLGPRGYLAWEQV